MAPTASAEILQVPRQHLSIQSALDAAQSGDTVLVAPGIYEGPANRNLDFRGKALSVIARAGPSATVLDCGGRGRGFRFRSGEDKYSAVLPSDLCPLDSISGAAQI